MSVNAVALLDHAKRLLGLATDKQLAQRLDISPSVICRIRNENRRVQDDLLIRLHEETGLSIADQKKILKREFLVA